jgi:hypothetical protein
MSFLSSRFTALSADRLFENVSSLQPINFLLIAIEMAWISFLALSLLLILFRYSLTILGEALTFKAVSF